MKYRPSIVIFAGDGARPSGAIFRAQLDLRAVLVSCVDLGGAEEDETTRHMMMTALGLFTADRLDSLVRDGLLDNIEVRDIPVLVVVHHSDSKLLRKAASALIEAARAYPNFDVKLRFTTLLISEAELGNARALGKDLLIALDGLVTADGITFQNTVLMVCKEMRGAPLSEASLAPILSRLILLVTTLDYDVDRSAFSAFWNAKIGGGGQVYFVGLVAYKADRVERSARTLLYREASSRLAGFLEGNPASILLNLRTDLLVASVVNALADTETGAGLARGSEKWNELADRYRKFVVPALLSDLLQNVKSISDLRCVLETIQQHTRVESDVRSNSTTFVASCGLALVALDVKWWAWLSVAAIAGVGAVMWKQWFGPKPPPPPPPVPKPQIIPYSPVFSEVLDELLEELGTAAFTGDTDDSSDGGSSDVRSAEKLPFCEFVFDAASSVRAKDAVGAAINDAGKDTVHLLFMTKLQGAKWLSAQMAADITELHHRSVRTIKAAILADFVEFAEGIEHDRGQSTSVQDVLFAPTLPIEQVHDFRFFGPELKSFANEFETCSVHNTINFLYLVE